MVDATTACIGEVANVCDHIALTKTVVAIDSMMNGLVADVLDRVRAIWAGNDEISLIEIERVAARRVRVSQQKRGPGLNTYVADTGWSDGLPRRFVVLCDRDLLQLGAGVPLKGNSYIFIVFTRTKLLRTA